MPARIVIVGEAEADSRIVRDLIDRKIRHHKPGDVETDRLEDCREWCGLNPGEQFTCWRDLKRIQDGRHRHTSQVRALGFSGPVGFDGVATRKALIGCALMEPRPDAIVLVRDMDNQAVGRRASIEAQRDHVAGSSGHIAVILALPHAKREAWVLNGFEAKTDREKTALSDLRKELGFDPCSCAEELQATSNHKKDPKRVVDRLLGSDHGREEACWLETDWNTLRQRGAKTGLKTFLHEVQTTLLPIITKYMQAAR